MRNKENICQYCTKQRAISTLSLNTCSNKMYQEISYLLIVSGFLNIILCYVGTNKCTKKMQVLTLPGYVLYFLTTLYFHISIRMFCNLFICLVFDGLLQSIYFWIFCSKHSIAFDTYLLSYRFHCVDIFDINFRSCETFTLKYSGTILLLIETPSNFNNIKCWLTLYLQMYVLGWCKFKCFVYLA